MRRWVNIRKSPGTGAGQSEEENLEDVGQNPSIPRDPRHRGQNSRPCAAKHRKELWVPGHSSS